MKSYLLWDHDGVLVETEPWYFEATRQCIRPLGVELEHARYLQDMAHGHSSWQQAAALGASPQQIASCKDQRNRLYQQFLLEQDIEIAGVESVLEELAANFAMAIVTTAKRSDFELIHAQRNIVDHMEFVLTSGDYPRSKPAPDPYLAALNRFSAAPEQALVIEDSERGLRSAVAAGIECVVVANEFVTGQDFSAAAYFIDSLVELPDLLREL